MSRLVDESTNGHPMAARDRPAWSLQTNNEQEGGKITEGLAEKAAKTGKGKKAPAKKKATTKAAAKKTAAKKAPSKKAATTR